MKRRSLIKFFATIPIAIALPMALAQPALDWPVLMVDQLAVPNNSDWQTVKFHNIGLKENRYYNFELTREKIEENVGEWMHVAWVFDPSQPTTHPLLKMER